MSKAKLSETFSLILFLLIPGMLVVGIPLTQYYNRNQLNNECHKKFGDQYEGREALYGQDVCVNSLGEVKYP